MRGCAAENGVWVGRRVVSTLPAAGACWSIECVPYRTSAICSELCLQFEGGILGYTCGSVVVFTWMSWYPGLISSLERKKGESLLIIHIDRNFLTEKCWRLFKLFFSFFSYFFHPSIFWGSSQIPLEHRVSVVLFWVFQHLVCLCCLLGLPSGLPWGCRAEGPWLSPLGTELLRSCAGSRVPTWQWLVTLGGGASMVAFLSHSHPNYSDKWLGFVSENAKWLKVKDI